MLHYLRYLGVTILVAALAWASFALWQTRPKERRNERTEHRPPLPPNCASVGDVSSITLPDGGLADVKIIQVRGTTLFVPASWLAYYFIDRTSRSGRFDRLEQFIPDIYEKECPGVVHALNLRGPTPRWGTNRGGVTSLTLFGHFAPKELQGTNGRTAGFNVDIQPTINPDGQEKSFPRSRSVGDYWIRPNKNFFILRSGPVNQEAKADYERELAELADWLMQAPAHRNNGRTFFDRQRFR